MTNPQTQEPLANVKVRIYELIDQQDSTYKLEGTEGENSVFLRAPGKKIIPSISLYIDSKGQYTRIRYIAGCNILDVREQDKLGYKPNHSTGADVIEFLTGKLVVMEVGDGKTLCEYLDKASFNADNPNRRPEATRTYREVKKEVEVQKAIDDFFTTKKVYDAIGKLAIAEGNKLRYKKDSIDFLCTLFQVTGIDAEDYKEKLQSLIEFGKLQPERFLKSIADEQAAMKVLVLSAIEQGAANFAGEKFVLTNGGRVITAVKSKKQEEKVQEVTDYLMTTEAFNDYQQLSLEVKQKNERTLLNPSPATTTEFQQED